MQSDASERTRKVAIDHHHEMPMTVLLETTAQRAPRSIVYHTMGRLA